MRTSFILLLSLLLVHVSFGQWVVLKDKDGFINVRQKPDVKSSIVKRLASGKILFSIDSIKNDWLPIIDYDSNDSAVGYVHKSRVSYIEDFTEFKIVNKNDTLLQFKLDSILITLKTGTFRKKGRILKFDTTGSNKELTLIDNKMPYGVDGDIPTTEYRAFTIQSGTNETSAAKKYWKDLFQPSFYRANAYFDKATNTIYVDSYNSDGAGGYYIVWVIVNGVMTGREIEYGL